MLFKIDRPNFGAQRSRSSLLHSEGFDSPLLRANTLFLDAKSGNRAYR
jgi:hypothetical protein